jgi:hypothetical protein
MELHLYSPIHLHGSGGFMCQIYTENPQILGASVTNSVDMATGLPKIVYPWVDNHLSYS